jgi:hypothetical protein
MELEKSFIGTTILIAIIIQNSLLEFCNIRVFILLRWTFTLKLFRGLVFNMYYVYKTTCLIDDSVYIGVHKSFDIENDSYLGSGLLISRYIKKYGKDCFVRTILYET